MTSAGGPLFGGRYEILDVIGRGGFATVHRALDGFFDRTVALKILAAGLSPNVREQFMQERRAAGKVGSHPNVVSVFDGGFGEDGEPFIAMELCPAGSLSAHVAAHGPLAADEVVIVGIQLADALAFAHGLGVLHRDVKPDNVLVTPHGVPALADFGIAKITHGTDTMATAGAFTPVHAAPEVFEEGSVQPASDVYSLASTLYELSSGSAPFAGEPGEGVHALMLRVFSQEVPPMEPGRVPPELEAVVRRGLEKDLRARTPSAEALGGELRAVAMKLGIEISPLRLPTPAPVRADATAPAVRNVPAQEEHDRRASGEAQQSVGSRGSLHETILRGASATDDDEEWDAITGRTRRAVPWKALGLVAAAAVATGIGAFVAVARPGSGTEAPSSPARIPIQDVRLDLVERQDGFVELSWEIEGSADEDSETLLLQQGVAGDESTWVAVDGAQTVREPPKQFLRSVFSAPCLRLGWIRHGEGTETSEQVSFSEPRCFEAMQS